MAFPRTLGDPESLHIYPVHDCIAGGSRGHSSPHVPRLWRCSLSPRQTPSPERQAFPSGLSLAFLASFLATIA